jgi:integrase
MSSLSEMLTFSIRNEHVLEHDLEHNLKIKKNFSPPKMYTANGDTSKRWYLYFSFRNPKTGKLKRMKNIYGNVNLFKTKEERLSILSVNRRNLLKLLQQGYNPFEDNSALYESLQHPSKSTSAISKEPTAVIEKPALETHETATVPQEVTTTEPLEPQMSLKDAFDYSLTLKTKVVNDRTLKEYQNRVDNFLKWLREKHPLIKTTDQLTKKLIMLFLNETLIRTGPRQRNNYRTDLGSLMQTLEDNDIIAMNFMKKIPVLKTTPERNKTYTLEKQEEIFNYLEKVDPILLLYIKFISYNFLRPIEVCRLRIKDINLKNNTLQFKAKNSPLKTKIIPSILVDDLPDLSKLNGDDFLFTPTAIGGSWEATETNRRDNFSKRYLDVVKKHFKLNQNYGLYSFRHTYITRLYRKMVKDSSPFAAKSELMVITGHTSMAALEKYLRDIDAELPEDYSHHLQ